MKNKFKILVTVLVATLFLTGCSKADLYNAYSRMSVGSSKGKISGYQVNIRLYGLYEDEKISDIVLVQNYQNKAFKVVDSTNGKTYYKVDGVNYVYTEEKSDDPLDFTKGFGVELDENGEPVEEETKAFTKVDEETPYTNTDVYLTSLIKAKSLEKPVKEEIATETFNKYSYSVSKAVMKRIMNETSLKDLKFKNDTKASCWIDKDGYVYKIEFDLKSGIGSKYDLKLAVFYASINDVSEITADNMN